MGPLSTEPIGKILQLSIGQWKEVPAVFASIEFFPDETGKRLFDKIVGGYLNSWSVGFVVNGYIHLEDGGRDVFDWTLLEASAVAVPANADTTTIIESGNYQGLQMKMITDGTKKLKPENIKFHLGDGRYCSMKELPAFFEKRSRELIIKEIRRAMGKVD